jgi:hypothetical protein
VSSLLLSPSCDRADRRSATVAIRPSEQSAA